MIRLLFLVLSMMSMVQAYARTLIVEGVVSPAWVERMGKREPLAVGMQLNEKDRIITGGSARVMLRMAEGSAVKLGENATLALDGLSEKQKPGNAPLVSAALDVVKGAFRFTTGVFSKAPAERDVKVKIATITAGVRGTDLWGRSTVAEDLVCLLEGRISVQHDKQEFVMDQPLQFFIAPRNEKPKPVGKVSQKQIDQWALETEIAEGQGAMRAGGRTRVELMRSADAGEIKRLESRLRTEGFPVVVETMSGSYGASEYAVTIVGVSSAKDRDTLMKRVKQILSGAPAGKPVN